MQSSLFCAIVNFLYIFVTLVYSSCRSESYYWQDAAKRRTAIIKFTHRPEISIFAPQGRLVAPIHVKVGTNKGHVGSLCLTKFHTSRFTTVVTWSQNMKNSTFGKESPRIRVNPWSISNIFMGFYTTYYPSLVFQIWRESLHRLQS